MSKEECFPDSLVLKHHGTKDGSAIFRLAKDFRVATSDGMITIPQGFLTDGASVPRIFWNILQPFGEYFPAALLHDFLYSKMAILRHPVKRRKADLLFREAMYNIGIGWVTRHVIYTAVRAFGWKGWRKS